MSEPVVPPVPPLPPYAAPAPPAGYAGPPAGYAGPPPGYSAGPYAAPYVLPGAPARPDLAPARRSPALGIVALVASLVAAVVTPIFAGVAGFSIGAGVGTSVSAATFTSEFDLSFLAPVREWVLLGEIAFWAGTVLDVWALVQGVIAIIRNAGRAQAIAAVAIAVAGPVLFGIVLQAALTTGLATGASAG